MSSLGYRSVLSCPATTILVLKRFLISSPKTGLSQGYIEGINVGGAVRFKSTSGARKLGESLGWRTGPSCGEWAWGGQG